MKNARLVVLTVAIAVFKHRKRRLLGLLTATLCATAFISVGLAQAEVVNLHVDEDRLIKLPEGVATVVLGNPLIADTPARDKNGKPDLLSANILVLTGKGYGTTNLLALDRTGRVVMDKTVEVRGAPGNNLVVVYKGVERETYSCNPKCQPRITLGDAPAYFNATLAQTGTRNAQAQTNAPR